MTEGLVPYCAKGCRVCGGKDLAPLFSLGEHYVNDFPEPGKAKAGLKCPLELELCQNPACELVQLRHTVPLDLMYSRMYWYRSGVTQTMRDALQDVVTDINSLVDLEKGDIVLDIGSNDGTLLKFFDPSLLRIGVEPANNLAVSENYEGLELIHEFWPVKGFLPYDKAKVVAALGMFYDLEDPVTFIRAAADCLHPDGLFIAQLMCLQNMIQLGDVGNINHEHLEYYSLQSLHCLFDQAGLEIFDIKEVPVNGSSYRLYARHKGCRTIQGHPGSYERLLEATAKEQNLADPKFYQRFFSLLEVNKVKVVRCIKQAISTSPTGQRPWVYGASTKGNTILQFYGLDNTLIEAAAERSPEKWGRVTVGTDIPIVSEEQFRKSKPDYALVLPYTFRTEIMAREKEWLENGGQFIFPLPTPCVVGAAGEEHVL